MAKQELTLLSAGQVFGDDKEEQLEVIKKYGTKVAITDLCILTGCYLERKSDYTHIAEDYSLAGRTGAFWTKSERRKLLGFDEVFVSNMDGDKSLRGLEDLYVAIRPVLHSTDIFSQISLNRTKGYNGTEEVEYGEYPQQAVSENMQMTLELKYNMGMNKTGRNYTFNSLPHKYGGSGEVTPITYEEYEYQGKKYIRIKANFGDSKFTDHLLSNGIEYGSRDYVWVEVSPVKWLIDDKTGLLISKKGLVSGIRFTNSDLYHHADFSKTEMKEYLDKYMIHDLTQSVRLGYVQDMSPVEQEKFEKNPYGLNFDQLSEEEIIKGAVESGIAVFLHGPSSEGKSARVKQIDPTCDIIYLRNATQESLNGKSVYNAATGEMIDIKPTWLKKLEDKCEKEPDRFHILFFDELTNALHSIQGMAFNIVLDREVNGIWKLPDNARIVAAGNDMEDSLAANQLAEPLFNRFAHVYIKTTTESWLKWASENNIHPAIYSYIAYKNGKTLRSKYDGEKPNADPRKWEMASKMLYKTESPEMLRALVGEDITREFVEFCNQPTITLDDVINNNYTDKDVNALNTAGRYATTMGLTQVDDENLEKVRGFAKDLGPEFGAIFDSLWTHGDENRLERMAEAELAEMPVGGIRK